MSLAAIKQVSELEQALREQQEAALIAAKKAVADAESAGLALLEKTRAEAEQETFAYMKAAEEEAARQADIIRTQAQTSCAELRRAAEGRLDNAVSLIVGRVVNA